MRSFTRTSAVLLVPLLLAGGTPPAAERYEIDRAHSRIGFATKHYGVATVRGHFNQFDGHIVLDPDDITKSTVRVTINTASIDTDNQRRDADLRGDGFFNTDQFPTIVFDGRRVERDGEQLVMVGDLTMRDVTREIRIPFELNGPVALGGRMRLGAEARVTINRKDYGLTWNRIVEGVNVVADDVVLELAIEAATARSEG
jgi:polyisoprenoid-binding protein YceI